MRFILIIAVFFIFSQAKSQSFELWGNTYNGGNSGVGTIFKTDSTGDNLSLVYSFELKNKGVVITNTELVEANNGNLYGATFAGGISDKGVFFKYNTQLNIYTALIEFDGPNLGSKPTGSLLKMHNGLLLGVAREGGLTNNGTLFEYNLSTGVCTKRIDFVNSNGPINPQGNLIQTGNGKIYGSSFSHFFEYDTVSHTITKTIDNQGIYFDQRLLLASNNKIYGICKYGGISGKGVLFELDILNDTVNIIYSFTSSFKYPSGGIMQASNGLIYGTTSLGGTNNKGSLFEFNPTTNVVIKRLDFSATISFGLESYLTQASPTSLFGIAPSNSACGNGTIWEYNISTNTASIRQCFTNNLTGSNPNSSMVLASNGKYYGLASAGGTNTRSEGMLYEFNSVIDTIIGKINLNETTLEGSSPYGEMIVAPNGKVYGLTSKGGTENKGVLYEIDPRTNSYSVKMNFTYAISGCQLTLAPSGIIYGITEYGGTNNRGYIFKYNTITGQHSIVYNFSQSNGYARKGLFYAPNGKLYGTTYRGGLNTDGTLFEFDPSTNTLITKIDFDYNVNGRFPVGKLIQASNGLLYGLTWSGGSATYGVPMGTIYEYNFNSNQLTTKFVFYHDSKYGIHPEGSLLEGANGKLYLVNSEGGSANNSGAIVAFDILTNTAQVLDSFPRINNSAQRPIGSLTEGLTGKLYGYTISSNVLYEYDYYSNNYSVKNVFTGPNGLNPNLEKLIRVNKCKPVYDTISTIGCNVYISPSGNYTYTQSGIYVDTIASSINCDSIITINLTIEKIDTSISIIHDLSAGVKLISNDSTSSYQWLDCGTNFNAIFGETNRLFIPQQNGNYAVELTSNRCIDTSFCHLVNGVGINEIINSLNSTRVVPNPTKGNLTVTFENERKDIEVAIYSFDGKLLHLDNYYTAKSFSFEIKGSPGLYIIEIRSLNYISQYYKVIKE